jgi:hypothetical protein
MSSCVPVCNCVPQSYAISTLGIYLDRVGSQSLPHISARTTRIQAASTLNTRCTRHPTSMDILVYEYVSPPNFTVLPTTP